MINKRGSTLTNWVYIILVVSLFLVIIQSQVLSPMNKTYGKNFSIGLSDSASRAIEDISATAKSSSDDIDEAEVSKLNDGITIMQIGGIAKRTFATIWSFASGEFIRVLLMEQLDFPKEVAVVLQIMIWISLIFIIVRIFTRGVTP